MRITLLVAVLLLGVLASCSSSERYQPLAVAPFFFHEPGASHVFVFHPRLLSRTEIALESSGNALPMRKDGSPEPFFWIVKATAYQRGKAVKSILLEPQAWWHANDHKHYKSISFKAFKSLGALPVETKVVIEVLRADPRFITPDPSLKVIIRASPVP